MELTAEQNPYGVRPGQTWQDRFGNHLIVDAIELRHGQNKGAPICVAVCVREHTGIRVHPRLRSFAGKAGSGYRKVSD